MIVEGSSRVKSRCPFGHFCPNKYLTHATYLILLILGKFFKTAIGTKVMDIWTINMIEIIEIILGWYSDGNHDEFVPKPTSIFYRQHTSQKHSFLKRGRGGGSKAIQSFSTQKFLWIGGSDRP